jgi:hypothetical protein
MFNTTIASANALATALRVVEHAHDGDRCEATMGSRMFPSGINKFRLFSQVGNNLMILQRSNTAAS